MKKSRDEIAQRLKEIGERVEDIYHVEYKNEPLPDEVKGEVDQMLDERSELEGLDAELELREKQLEELRENPIKKDESTGPLQVASPRASEARDNPFDLSSVTGNPAQRKGELHERARRINDSAVYPHSDKAVAQTAVERLLRKDTPTGEIAERIVFTGSPAYERAFAKTIAGAPLSPDEQRVISHTGNAGGFAMPFTLDPSVIPTEAGVVNPLRAISRVEQITTKEWKGVTSGGVEASFGAETAEAEDGTATYAQPEIVAHRAHALLTATFEASEDWSAIAGEIGREATAAKNNLEATKFLLGEGTNEPFGVQVGAEEAEETEETATENKFVAADLYTAKGALGPNFVPNASWLANDGVYDLVRQFDESGGADLWVRLGEGRPAELLGKPAYEMSTMSAEIASEKIHAIYGDFEAGFVIVDRVGMSVEVIPHITNEGKATGKRGYYVFWRTGSKVVNAGAFVALEGK